VEQRVETKDLRMSNIAVAVSSDPHVRSTSRGRSSFGKGQVTRQYCGVLGKQDNCQVAVTVTMANEAVSVPAAYRLYLPESWADDRRRRREAGIPKEVTFKTKCR
jgi:SRSO17 transposase